MENTTAVNAREEAGAFPLPAPPNRLVLSAWVCFALLVCFALVVGVYLIGAGLVRAPIALSVLGYAVIVIALYGLRVRGLLDTLTCMQRATTSQLELLEGLAQQDSEVRLYLRRIYYLGRPILAADLLAVLERDNRIKKAAEGTADAQGRAEREQAVQARIWALVAAPDQPAPPTSAPEQSA